MPLVFVVKCGITTCNINFESAAKLLGEIPNAYLSVSIGAAASVAVKIANTILGEAQQFNEKAENELLSITTSEQISQIVVYFEKMDGKIKGQLQQQFDTLVATRDIITQQYSQRESQIRLIENAINSFSMMKEKIANLSQILASRKRDMLEQFTNDIHGQNGIIFVSQQTLQKISQSLKNLASTLD